MATNLEFVTRLDGIILTKGKSSALENRNRTLRWLVDVAGHAGPKGQDLEAAGLAALDRLPVLSFLPGCLLRLLAHADLEWLRDNPWRSKLVQYVEKMVGAAFYSGSITEASQTHEKISCLVMTVGTVENRFHHAIAQFSSLDKLAASRQALLAQLNGR
jgi:hypothetical protein